MPCHSCDGNLGKYQYKDYFFRHKYSHCKAEAVVTSSYFYNGSSTMRPSMYIFGNSYTGNMAYSHKISLFLSMFDHLITHYLKSGIVKVTLKKACVTSWSSLCLQMAWYLKAPERARPSAGTIMTNPGSSLSRESIIFMSSAPEMFKTLKIIM